MQTIQKDCRTEIVIEKSRFICTLKKVGSETEAQEFIKSIKKEFWDAGVYQKHQKRILGCHA